VGRGPAAWQAGGNKRWKGDVRDDNCAASCVLRRTGGCLNDESGFRRNPAGGRVQALARASALNRGRWKVTRENPRELLPSVG
jgi:hypothetical protein